MIRYSKGVESVGYKNKGLQTSNSISYQYNILQLMQLALNTGDSTIGNNCLLDRESQIIQRIGSSTDVSLTTARA